MSALILNNLKPLAAEKIKPFLEEILSTYRDRIHSIHVTGTATTDDYDPKVSDVNSLFVLKEMDLKFLELIAPLGKKYGKKRVSAPLIMTPDYIQKSLDVFPVEFLNFKLIHTTVFGEDILDNIDIDRKDLRHQCERELKVKLIWLRQSYISSLGNKKFITLLGKEPPLLQGKVIASLAESTGINTGVFSKILMEKHEKIKLSLEELNTIFEDYYSATEKLGSIVDEIKD
jgi:hypothetical protein